MRTRQRVLLLSGPAVGGMRRHVESLAAGLPERGFEAAVAAPAAMAVGPRPLPAGPSPTPGSALHRGLSGPAHRGEGGTRAVGGGAPRAGYPRAALRRRRGRTTAGGSGARGAARRITPGVPRTPGGRTDD